MKTFTRKNRETEFFATFDEVSEKIVKKIIILLFFNFTILEKYIEKLPLLFFARDLLNSSVGSACDRKNAQKKVLDITK